MPLFRFLDIIKVLQLLLLKNKYSEDTEGGWTVTLEEQKAPKSALFLYKTSYEATKTAINTLTAEPAE